MPRSLIRNNEPLVRDLLLRIECSGVSDTSVVRKAGVCTRALTLLRQGKSSISLSGFVALANAAGYNVVLRSRNTKPSEN